MAEVQKDFQCPICESSDIKILSKTMEGQDWQPVLTRQRKCKSCGHKFESAEILLEAEISTTPIEDINSPSS